MSPRCIALDLEFIKCRGEYFSRSIAFVPFRKCRSHETSNAAANTTSFHSSYHTAFSPPPCVLTLSTSEVMRTAELLPCGNVLASKVKSYLPSEDVLYAVKQKYLEEAAESMTFYRDMRKDMREKLKAEHKTQKHKEIVFTNNKKSTIGSSSSSSSSSSSDDNYKEHHDVNATADDKDNNKVERVEMKELNNNHYSKGNDTSKDQHGLSEAEVALRRNLQIRVSIAQYFECIDPHSIPNIFCDCNGNSNNNVKQQLISLYLAPLGSLEYTHALHALSPLRKYGRGRGGHKSLLFVCRYYPEFAREILQRCFPTEQIWLHFLKESAELVQADLNAFVSRYSSLSSSNSTFSTLSRPSAINELEKNLISEDDDICNKSPNVITSINTNGEPCNAIVFRQCHSLEQLSHEMSAQWSAYLYNALHTCSTHTTNNTNSEINSKVEITRKENQNTQSEQNSVQSDVHKMEQEQESSEPSSSSSMCKFFVYGNVDKRVIRTTLQLSCKSQSTPSNNITGNINNTISNGHIGAVPTHCLLSPFQAQVTDITKHTLFTLSGFKQSEKQIPSLSSALEKTLKYDNTAKLLWNRNQAHDPLWDAQALACVCAACNVCK